MTDPGTAARTLQTISTRLISETTRDSLYPQILDAAITLMTGRSVWFSGTRQVLVGIAAAVLTYGIGKLIGVSVG